MTTTSLAQRVLVVTGIFKRGLASRLDRGGIVVHVVHPGPLHTRFQNYNPRTVIEGADTVIWRPSEPTDLSTDGYFYD